MKRLLIILAGTFLFIGKIFATYPITYVREYDSKVKEKAHQKLAVPAYLQTANYYDLIKKGQEYEKAEKWIYAYGTYVDASVISNGDTEAIEKAEAILSVISNGKPGKGTFDVFTMYDKWVDLITESEKYFTEFPAFEMELKEPVQKEIHYDTRTADYEVTINTYFTEKANNLYLSLKKGFEEAKKDDWKIKPWFIHESYKPETIKAAIISYDDFKARTPALEKMKTVVANGQKEGIAIASWLNTYNPYEDDKRSSNNTHYNAQLPAFFASVYIEKEEWAQSRRFMDGLLSLYDMEIALFNKQDKMLAKPIRVNLEELGKNATSSWFPRKAVFKNLDRDMMSKIEAGEVVAKATGLYLHYGVLTVPSTDTKYSNELITNIIRKLPEMKIDLNKAVVYNSNEMFAKLDDANIEKFLQSVPKEDEDKLIYGYFDGYENMADNDPEHPHYKALANRMSIEQGLNPAHYQDQDGEKVYDSSKWVFDKIGDVSGYDRKYALRKTWASIKTDESTNGYYVEKYIGRETDDIRLCRKDFDYKARKQKEQAESAEREKIDKQAWIAEQEEIASKKELKYLREEIIKDAIYNDKLHTTISYSDLGINKSNQIFIKQLTKNGSFEKASFQKGDVIINVYTEDEEDLLSLFKNISRHGGNLDNILRNLAEITFTVKRGKGNKEQVITIDMPIEFNANELKLIEQEIERKWNEEYTNRMNSYEEDWEYVREEKVYR